MRPASYAPYLDLRPATDVELPAIRPLVEKMDWLQGDVENRALDYGIDVLSAEHLAEVRSRTLERVAKVKAAVQERLTREVTYWDHRASELQLQTDAGKIAADESRSSCWTCRRVAATQGGSTCGVGS